MLYSSQFTRSLAIWNRLGFVWRCGGGWGAQTTPSHSTPPFGYPIQHGQPFDPSLCPFSLILSAVMLSAGYSPLLCCPPERSFLAYAFPLLDTCSLRLSYLYLSSFPISAVSTPCAVIPFAYDHHHHYHNPLFVFIYLEEKRNQRTYKLPSCLSFVNTLMCIACFG
jgi:hypothetical protein